MTNIRKCKSHDQFLDLWTNKEITIKIPRDSKWRKAAVSRGEERHDKLVDKLLLFYRALSDYELEPYPQKGTRSNKKKGIEKVTRVGSLLFYRVSSNPFQVGALPTEK